MSRSVSEFKVLIAEILEAETKMAREAIDETAQEVGKETVQLLKQTSPRGRKRRRRRYANGWSVKKQPTHAGNIAYVVHNRTDGPLTHLLEKGHALPQGGRSQAFPHIKPAEDQAIAKFEQKLAKRIEKG